MDFVNNLTENEIKQLNDFDGFLRFKKTWAFSKLVNSKSKVTALFTGNQFGKTAGVAFQYVMRVLGIHPVIERNVNYVECSLCENTWHVFDAPEKCTCGGKTQLHERITRTFRFCSEVLPGSGSENSNGESEVKNTQYPAIKRWLPNFLLKRDITFREHTMILNDPLGGKDIIFEFIGYNQTVQSTAGVQRLSVWYDEEPDVDFRNEQIPRLLAENGDEIFSVTPANQISWMFDDIYENACVYYRTVEICKALKEEGEEFCEQVKTTNSEKSITVIQASTYDNPTLKRSVIDDLYSGYDHDTVLTRCYGFFKQSSGRIFKDFNTKVHVVDEEEVFPDGFSSSYVFGRGIDYHPQTPWAFAGMFLTQQDEAFVFIDGSYSPEKLQTDEIARLIGDKCEDFEFSVSLIDPLSEAFKRSEGGKSITVRDDLNRFSYSNGYSSGSWLTWDTKGEKGRDEIRKRLKNSLKCKKPFSNTYYENGYKKYLPTIWIFSKCKNVENSLRHWRWEEFSDLKTRQTKEAKNKPEQKWSHHCMVLEALFKNYIFRFNQRNSNPSKHLKKKFFKVR